MSCGISLVVRPAITASGWLPGLQKEPAFPEGVKAAEAECKGLTAESVLTAESGWDPVTSGALRWRTPPLAGENSYLLRTLIQQSTENTSLSTNKSAITGFSPHLWPARTKFCFLQCIVFSLLEMLETKEKLQEKSCVTLP